MAKDWSFFDIDKARGPDDSPDVGEDVTDEILRAKGDGSAAAMSVSVLIARIKNALADAFPRIVSVVGELSNVKRHDSGHIYFRLKDANAAIDAVMFRREAAKLKFAPVDGLEVVAEGQVDVYDVRGQLQLYVQQLTPKGAGALELAFRQLREKLAADGVLLSPRPDPIGERE